MVWLEGLFEPVSLDSSKFVIKLSTDDNVSEMDFRNATRGLQKSYVNHDC